MMNKVAFWVYNVYKIALGGDSLYWRSLFEIKKLDSELNINWYMRSERDDAPLFKRGKGEQSSLD